MFTFKTSFNEMQTLFTMKDVKHFCLFTFLWYKSWLCYVFFFLYHAYTLYQWVRVSVLFANLMVFVFLCCFECGDCFFVVFGKRTTNDDIYIYILTFPFYYDSCSLTSYFVWFGNFFFPFSIFLGFRYFFII